jgi:diacylglycerol kinase (ATP)
MTTSAVSSSTLPVLRRAVVIVHDFAPRAHAADWRSLVHGSLGRDAVVQEVRVSSFDDARAAAAQASAAGVDLIIAVGGDGTVNACVNGIGDRGTRLAVIPAGTANDLARQVGLRRSPSREAMSLHLGKRRRIDAISVNGTQFCSVGGMGWIADVANLANHWRSGGWLSRAVLARLGGMIYNLACVVVILFWRRLSARYSITYRDATDDQDKALDLECYAILVANTNRIGKSFELAPDSSTSDGIFELIVIPRTTRRRLLRTVAAATRGRLFQSISEVELLRVRSASIAVDRPVTFFGDGEILLRDQRRLELSVAAEPVRLIGPESVKFRTLGRTLAGAG